MAPAPDIVPTRWAALHGHSWQHPRLLNCPPQHPRHLQTLQLGLFSNLQFSTCFYLLSYPRERRQKHRAHTPPPATSLGLTVSLQLPQSISYQYSLSLCPADCVTSCLVVQSPKAFSRRLLLFYAIFPLVAINEKPQNSHCQPSPQESEVRILEVEAGGQAGSQVSAL